MIWVIIPARLDSVRLPRKLLLDDTGHPLIWHSIQQAKRSKADQVVVLTDSREIFDVVSQFDVKLVMTGSAASGTERIANYIAARLGFHVGTELWGNGLKDSDIIVNFQGDEPELSGVFVDKLASALDGTHNVATLATPILNEADYVEPNVVKVVCDHHDNALYFSRAPIPWGGASNALRHVGIYAFRAKFLVELSQLPASTLPTERLEQLQWLQATERIKVLVDDVPSRSIDSLADYQGFVQRLIRPS